MSFGEWAERWYATTADLKPSTRRSYRQLLDNKVLPTFERATLAGIDTLAVREWLAGLVGSGLSPARSRNAYRVLSQVLATAVEADRIVRNPAAGVRLPKVVRREMQFLTAVQVEALAEAIVAPYGVLIRFAAYSGLRFGELAGLRVGRLDLLRGTCEVVESVQDLGGRLVWGTTKTNERRRVRLPRFLCEELAAYLAVRSHGPEELVFRSPTGATLRERKFLDRQFRPAVRRAGLPVELRIHDLRHTAASLLIVQGASMKAVQAQLGHRSATVTLDRYGHLFPDELEHLAERLDRARAEALTDQPRTESGPPVVMLRERAGQ